MRTLGLALGRNSAPPPLSKNPRQPRGAMRRISHISIAAPIRDLMDVTGSDASKLRIGDVVHGAQRSPLAARDRRQSR
jgi:hypothetical protein